ncbi:HNH endonuclease [Candidatus Poribacteria bacterium]|nr:HNH endonuclease [Candidatus Poribacteria bacterium]
MTPKVFVVEREGKPCLPTHPARARKLLREGKARVYQVVPFTIQLERVIENPVSSFTVGIDDGAKEIGIAVVNEATKEVVFRGTIQLRQEVSKKLKQRAQYRSSRRSRKLRYRKARFLNRKHTQPLPSIRQRKESLVRVVKELKKILNLTHAVIEQGKFDVASLSAGRELVGIKFTQSEYEGKNFRAKVLWRDHYTCQHCGGKAKLNAHHLLPRNHGGTDTPQNGMTLCEKCHVSLHKREWVLDKKPAVFKYPMHLMQGKRYLVEIIQRLGLEVTTCLGWMTTHWRKQCELDKSHPNDAIAMVFRNDTPGIASLEYTIRPKRAKVWSENPTKQGEEKLGFRHFDLVKAQHRTKGWVVGSVRSLKAKVMTLRTKEDDNFPVSYRKSLLLCRFNRIIYSY